MASVYKPRKATTDFFLKEEYGVVGRYLHSKAVLIKQAAKRQVGVQTGRLKNSIHIVHQREVTGQAFKIGSPLSYALMHHEGTKPHMIYPDKARVLRFTSGSRIIYAREVRHPGTKPNRYLTNNLYLIR